jgi:hypothetical protein
MATMTISTFEACWHAREAWVRNPKRSKPSVTLLRRLTQNCAKGNTRGADSLSQMALEGEGMAMWTGRRALSSRSVLHRQLSGIPCF